MRQGAIDMTIRNEDATANFISLESSGSELVKSWIYFRWLLSVSKPLDSLKKITRGRPESKEDSGTTLDKDSKSEVMTDSNFLEPDLTLKESGSHSE